MKRPILLLLALAAATSAAAAELTGKVVAVEGDAVRIALDGSWLPQPGDAVTIHFEIPGVSKVRVGSWRVARVEGMTVVATLVEATGAPAVDQLATIASANPVPRRAEAAAPPAAAGPGFLGAHVGNAAGFALVEKVAPGGPAERGGLRVGDVILGVDDVRVSSPEGLAGIVRSKGAGARLALRINRNASETDVVAVLDAPPAFPDVPEAPEPYNPSVGWSSIVTGRARVEYKGREFDTIYDKQIKSGIPYAIELYFFDTPPAGKNQPVVNGQRLTNRFLREPAADHHDQSKAIWRLYHFEYRKGEWQFHDTPNVKVSILSQPGR